MHFKIYGLHSMTGVQWKTWGKEARKIVCCQKAKQSIEADSKNDPVTGTIIEEIPFSSD